jgi:hypothetical protein
MKYTLRSLMIGITVFCVLLGLIGARVEYLRRWAAFHKQEARECRARTHAHSTAGREPDEEYYRELSSMVRHTFISTHYEYAAYHRPWTIVDESKCDAPSP